MICPKRSLKIIFIDFIFKKIIPFTFKIHISNQLGFSSYGILNSIYSHVNDCCSLLDHIGCDQIRNAWKWRQEMINLLLTEDSTCQTFISLQLQEPWKD